MIYLQQRVRNMNKATAKVRPTEKSQRSRGSRSNRYTPQWSTTATAKVRPTEKSTKFRKNLDLRGWEQNHRERSSKSKPKRLHPGAKVWIQEVLLCQQWSAEDVIVGSINERSADGSRNQDHKTNKRWSAEAVIVSGNILVPRSGSKKSTDGSRDQ